MYVHCYQLSSTRIMFKKMTGSIIYTMFLLLGCGDGEMDFTYSPSDLYRLIQTEQRVSNKLTDLVNSIRDFSWKFKSTGLLTMKQHHPDDIIKNPLLSYQLVKRHTEDFKSFDEALNVFASTLKTLSDSYIKARTTFTNPGETDLNYAMEAIIRLRQTYNLSVVEISQGQLGNVRAEGSLSPKDLAAIGMYAKKSGMKVNSRLFLEAALKLGNTLAENEENWVDDARTTLASLDNETISSGAKKQDREDFRVLTEMDAIFATDSLENLNRAFEDLCQRNTVKDPPLTTLKCYTDRKSHPARQISPLKIEVVHEDPQVVVIYDFMSDKEIAVLEDATFHQLKRSHTQFYIQGMLRSQPSIIRTTSQTWIHDLGHPTFGYLSKRIESVTGYYLSSKNSAEELQVGEVFYYLCGTTYRPGGHYSLHTDATQEEVLKEFLQTEDFIQGDRLATFMIYLSNVEGGNTAFPLLNISVRPVKGSAILWSNVYPDGNIARDSLHGACPVVLGVKNIATKWIRANDQMFTRNNCKRDKSFNHFSLH